MNESKNEWNWKLRPHTQINIALGKKDKETITRDGTKKKTNKQTFERNKHKTAKIKCKTFDKQHALLTQHLVTQ